MPVDPASTPVDLEVDVTVPDSLADVEAVQSVRTPIRIEYTYTPGKALSTYLRGMADKKILAERCPKTGQVFIPPRGVSPVAGIPTVGPVELPDVGYVESFNITRVPIATRPELEPPYCSAWIVLDGASVGFMGLVINCEPESVHMGMRVRAVWKPDDELEMAATNILGWEPSGEPDSEIPDIETIGRPGDRETIGRPGDIETIGRPGDRETIGRPGDRA